MTPEDLQIRAAVVSNEEDILAVVAAVYPPVLVAGWGDVVRHPRNNDSGAAWHDPTLPAPARRVKAPGADRHQRGAGRKKGGCRLFTSLTASSAVSAVDPNGNRNPELD